MHDTNMASGDRTTSMLRQRSASASVHVARIHDVTFRTSPQKPFSSPSNAFPFPSCFLSPCASWPCLSSPSSLIFCVCRASLVASDGGERYTADPPAACEPASEGDRQGGVRTRNRHHHWREAASGRAGGRVTHTVLRTRSSVPVHRSPAAAGSQSAATPSQTCATTTLSTPIGSTTVLYYSLHVL